MSTSSTSDSALREVNQKISSATGRQLTDKDFEYLDHHTKQFAFEYSTLE